MNYRAVLALCLCICACSVKENRADCPCELTVRPQGAVETDGSVLVSVIQDGTVVKQGMLSREEFEEGKCRLSVSRKATIVTVFAGITEMDLLRGRRLDIRKHHQCDAVFSCSEVRVLDSDSYECIVKLHKNYARLDMTVVNMPDEAGLNVSGSVQGYDMLDSQPYEGNFNCTPEDGESVGSCSLRLPRQLSFDLSMNLSEDGGSMMSIPLGKLIAMTGYSFEDEDLKDISMTLDLQKLSIRIAVGGWDEQEIPISVN